MTCFIYESNSILKSTSCYGKSLEVLIGMLYCSHGLLRNNRHMSLCGAGVDELLPEDEIALKEMLYVTLFCNQTINRLKGSRRIQP